MTIKTLVFLLAALASMAIGAAAGLAATNEDSRRVERPIAAACKDEIAKYCVGKQFRNGEVRKCLQDYHYAISQTCDDALNNTGKTSSRPNNN